MTAASAHRRQPNQRRCDPSPLWPTLDHEDMTGDTWRPVTTIGDHGLVLAIGPDGSWQVIDGEQARGPAAGRGLMMLLPLLERTYEQVGDEVADQVADGFPAPLWD